MSIELQNLNQHQMLGATFVNIVWGQSDNGVRMQIKKHKDFQNADNDNTIIYLFWIINKVFANGELGNVCDPIYWVIHQHRKLTIYTQIQGRKLNLGSKSSLTFMTHNYCSRE